MLKTKQPTFADDAVVVAITSIATNDDFVTVGERRRGSNKTVRSHPDAWVLDGTPRSEWPDLFAASIARHEPEPTRPKAEPIPDEELAICSVTYNVGFRSFAKGSKLRWDDPAVQRNRHFWRMAPLPVPEA